MTTAQAASPGLSTAGVVTVGVVSRLILEDLLCLERAGWDSLCSSWGAEFYGDLMTDDGLMVLVNGAVLDRDAVTASLGAAPAWDGYRISEEQLVPLGEDAAVLVYRASAHRGDVEFEALMASTYRVVEGRPRLALYQQTTITH